MGVRATRLCAALAIATLLTGAACSDDSEPTAERDILDDGDAPTTSSTASSSTTAAPLAGTPLRVAEQGYSTFPDPIDPTATLGGYGVIVANPDPALMATGVTVRSRILASDGTVLFDDSALLNGIMPGASMAVGGTLLEPIEDPVKLDVAVQVAAWLKPAATDSGLIAEGIATEPEEGGGAKTRFSVRSTWPADEEGVDVTAIYRAADGRILAGEQTALALVPAGGSVDGEIRLLTPIPDLARTDVLVGRGFAAQTVG